MDFTSCNGRAILRQIQFQLASARRKRRPVHAAELASRITRKYPSASRVADELSAEITVRAAKAGLPVYLAKRH
jgi:hypothetical protein